jgi:hypothetical protein
MGRIVIDVKSRMVAEKVNQGVDFISDGWFLINEKYPKASIRLKFTMKYLNASASAVAQAKIEADKQSSDANIFNQIKNKALNKVIEKVGKLGKPGTAQFQLRIHLYLAKGLTPTDESGLTDCYGNRK